MITFAGNAELEHVVIDRLVDRLAGQFPDLTAEEIEHAVQSEYASYADSPVRTYLPVLVERTVRTRLTTSAHAIALPPAVNANPSATGDSP